METKKIVAKRIFSLSLTKMEPHKLGLQAITVRMPLLLKPRDAPRWSLSLLAGLSNAIRTHNELKAPLDPQFTELLMDL